MKTIHSSLLLVTALALVGLCLISVPTAQASQGFAARLNGAQETPPNGSAGTGNGSVILSDDQTTITVNLNFTGLGSNASNAHIHTGPPGVAGPITFPLTGVPAATSGTFPQQSFSITPAQVTDLQNGNLYFNIHSSGFPGGEIRGQILLASCTPPPVGMVSWFPGDGNAQDILSNTLDLSVNGGVTFPAGKVAQAFDFDGTGDVTYSTINAG